MLGMNHQVLTEVNFLWGSFRRCKKKEPDFSDSLFELKPKNELLNFDKLGGLLVYVVTYSNKVHSRK